MSITRKQPAAQPAATRPGDGHIDPLVNPRGREVQPTARLPGPGRGQRRASDQTHRTGAELRPRRGRSNGGVGAEVARTRVRPVVVVVCSISAQGRVRATANHDDHANEKRRRGKAMSHGPSRQSQRSTHLLLRSSAAPRAP